VGFDSRDLFLISSLRFCIVWATVCRSGQNF
jgi:hypothetical protein